MDNQYIVTFEGTDITFSGEELINFVKIAVVNNKDISNFKVKRL